MTEPQLSALQSYTIHDPPIIVLSMLYALISRGDRKINTKKNIALFFQFPRFCFGILIDGAQFSVGGVKISGRFR